MNEWMISSKGQMSIYLSFILIRSSCFSLLIFFSFFFIFINLCTSKTTEMNICPWQNSFQSHRQCHWTFPNDKCFFVLLLLLLSFSSGAKRGKNSVLTLLLRRNRIEKQKKPSPSVAVVVIFSFFSFLAFLFSFLPPFFPPSRRSFLSHSSHHVIESFECVSNVVC